MKIQTSNQIYVLQRDQCNTLGENKKENEAYSSQSYEWRHM